MTTLRQIGFAFVAAVALASGAAGQVVRGQVRDTLTTAPLANVSITVTDAQRQQVAALTTTDGTFTLTALAPGKYELAVRRLGYNAKVQPLQVEAGKDTLVIAWMVPLTTTLQPVQVRAKWLGTWWRPNLTRGAEYVRRHIALGKGVIVSGDEIRASGLPMTEYLGSFEGILLGGVAGRGIPVAPGARGRFLTSSHGASCLYVRIDRMSMAYLLIDKNIEDIDDLLKISDIMAVEVFRNSQELPPEWKMDATIEALVQRRNGGLRYVMGHTTRPKLTTQDFQYDRIYESGNASGPIPICGFMQIWTKIAW